MRVSLVRTALRTAFRTALGISLRTALRVAIPLIAAAACSVYTDTPLTADPTATRVFLTDAPFPYDRLARVDLYVVSVSGSLSPDTSAGGGAFVTLATPNRRIDVLALQGGVTEQLGALKLAAGVITAVRMVIDTDSSSLTLTDGRILTSTSSPGIQWQSSAGRPLLNAVVFDTIKVVDSGTVVIDFDVGAAFIPVQVVSPGSTDSSFIFSPVITAKDGRRSGSISGVVRAGSASGTPIANASIQLYLPTSGLAAENTWSVVGHARTDATGAFIMPYVIRSAFWRNGTGLAYNLSVDPPAGTARTRQVLTNISVTAGQASALGTIVLP